MLLVNLTMKLIVEQVPCYCRENRAMPLYKFRYIRNYVKYWILRQHSAVFLPQHGLLVSDHSNAEITHSTVIFTAMMQNHGDSRQDAVLSQGGPRNAAINFGTRRPIEVYSVITRFLCQSAAFLHRPRPTSATVQMLKLQKVHWFSRPWHEVTAIAENHGTRPVKVTMIDIIDDTDNIGPSLLRDLCPSQPQGHKFTCSLHGRTQVPVYGSMYCIWRPLPEEPPRISARTL